MKRILTLVIVESRKVKYWMIHIDWVKKIWKMGEIELGYLLPCPKAPLFRECPLTLGLYPTQNNNFTNIERCNMANKSATTCQNMQQGTWGKMKNENHFCPQIP
jgi:hypothetical protein